MFFYPTTNIELPPTILVRTQKIKSFPINNNRWPCLMSQEVIKGFNKMCYFFPPLLREKQEQSLQKRKRYIGVVFVEMRNKVLRNQGECKRRRKNQFLHTSHTYSTIVSFEFMWFNNQIQNYIIDIPSSEQFSS